MGLSVEERAKAIAKLGEAQAQERDLEAQYKRAQDLFGDAWRTYGSELAGSNDAIDRLGRELTVVRQDRVILEMALAGNPDIRSREALVAESAVLEKRVKEISDSLAAMDRLAELLK